MTHEFVAGPDRLSVEQTPPKQSLVGDRMDRDEDLDGDDLLDVIAAGNWSLVKQFEKVARESAQQGIVKVRVER